MAKIRITAKQKSARRKNIAIARMAKKKNKKKSAFGEDGHVYLKHAPYSKAIKKKWKDSAKYW